MEATTNYSFEKWAKGATQEASEYLKWAGSDWALKINSYDIPEPIAAGLPFTNGKIHDVRVVIGGNNRRRGKRTTTTEDQIYERSVVIRKRVARGNTLLSGKLSDGSDFTVFPLRGLKKFTGGMGDEDEQEDGGAPFVWKKFFLAPLESATQIISTTKENGAAAHLSVIKLSDDNFIFLGGSKNVHIIARTVEDLQHYNEENRWSVAKKIMKTCFDFMDSLELSKRLKLLNYLATTHQTACFEMLDPEDQHVEVLDYLTSPVLKFISFCPEGKFEHVDTSNEKKKNENENEKKDNKSETNPKTENVPMEFGKELLCVNPVEAYKIAEELGFHVVNYEVHQIKEGEVVDLEKLMTDIRKGYGNEGKVLYFIDNSNRVIGLLKKKSVWYIVLRALREKVKCYLFKSSKLTNKFTEKVELGKLKDALEPEFTGLPKRIRTRMSDIQNWLKLDDETVLKWSELGITFSEWLFNKIVSGDVDVQMLANKFPLLWKQFLDDTKLSDKIIPGVVQGGSVGMDDSEQTTVVTDKDDKDKSNSNTGGKKRKRGGRGKRRYGGGGGGGGGQRAGTTKF